VSAHSQAGSGLAASYVARYTTFIGFQGPYIKADTEAKTATTQKILFVFDGVPTIPQKRIYTLRDRSLKVVV
jgi:hypothetical protein